MFLSDYDRIVYVRIFEDGPLPDADLIYPEKAAVLRLKELGFIEKVDGKWSVRKEGDYEN